MEALRVFRHEYKYIVNINDMHKIVNKLKDILVVDRSIDGYMVRSLYFDSFNNKDYYDKMNGNLVRKKIRLRIYQYDTDKVKLEIKNKIDMHQLKESLIISKNDALRLIQKDYSPLLTYHSGIATKLYIDLMFGCYAPKCIIEYQRIAFISKMNTRITFDFNISSTRFYERFFDEKINYDKIQDDHKVVMEVKFDRFLEPYIDKILSNFASDNQSVSKYIIGRS